MSSTLEAERTSRRDSPAAEAGGPKARSISSAHGMASETAKRANLDIAIYECRDPDELERNSTSEKNARREREFERRQAPLVARRQLVRDHRRRPECDR